MQDWITVVVPILAALSGVVLGWLGRAKEAKREVRQDAEQDATIRYDIEYIKRAVDDVRAEGRSSRHDIIALAERQARSEESIKSLHKRVDRMEEKPVGQA